MIGDSVQVARILYKELVEGDLRKLQAQANDSDSGGGARDFRFRSFDKLLPIIRMLFPEIENVERRRNRRPSIVERYKGTFYWHDAHGNVQSKAGYMEPPTSARPGEGRIPCVHEYPCFDASQITLGVGNRALLLLIQLKDGTVWPYYAQEASLRETGRWDATVARELLSCLDADRPENLSVLGFRDFTNFARYCNGK